MPEASISSLSSSWLRDRKPDVAPRELVGDAVPSRYRHKASVRIAYYVEPQCLEQGCLSWMVLARDDVEALSELERLRLSKALVIGDLEFWDVHGLRPAETSLGARIILAGIPNYVHKARAQNERSSVVGRSEWRPRAGGAARPSITLRASAAGALQKERGAGKILRPLFGANPSPILVL